MTRVTEATIVASAMPLIFAVQPLRLDTRGWRLSFHAAGGHRSLHVRRALPQYRHQQ